MPKKYNSQTTIETILTVSVKLFLEKGFEKTSIQDIAESAKMSKGAIYHHFQSKDEIIKAVTERQAQITKSAMEGWLSEASTLNGKEKLQFILEKNIEKQEAHYLDNVMCASAKSAEFVYSFMQDCMNKNAFFVSEIMKQGVADGSLMIEFPDECAEVFLLLIDVWCDPAIFDCDIEKSTRRLRFLQHTMKSIGVDVLSDALIERTLSLLQNLYARRINK